MINAFCRLHPHLLRAAAALWLLLPFGAIAQDATPLVKVEPLSAMALYPLRSVPATVLSLNDSRISAEVRGRVEAVPVKVGQIVRAGDLLVRLDCRDHEFELRQRSAAQAAAAARVTLATKQLERAQSLVGAKNISEELVNQRQAELETAQAELQAARAAHASAGLQVERCALVAPFEGIVVERYAQVGELANPGTPMVRLLDRVGLEISAQIPSSLLGGLADAGKVWLEADGARYNLRLRAVTPALNTQARSAEARFVFVDRTALPGAAGRVVWQATTAHVPADLLVRRGEQLGVFVADDDRARFVPVPGASEGQPAAVDLPPQSLLITEGRYGLIEGAGIQVQP